ncbi:MAG: YifB family Mg chelatase-like AAA ATPase [Patescibacteria group bacterium]|nr:YifB family Mg chelatase-like AAA ATPase [Patescibacteria group bacterium]
MIAKVYSAAVVGLDAQPIEVEVDLSAGLHCFQIVGLPGAAVNESKDRVSSAIKNSGITPPYHSRRRVIVNLAPADLKKEGPAYDLPIAMAFLLASGQVSVENTTDKIFIGELSLEGALRRISGVLPIALAAKEKGFKTIFLPIGNAVEAALVKGLEVIPVNSLKQLIAHLKGERLISKKMPARENKLCSKNDLLVDMAHIKGQEQSKRALEIAAAGAHNILMRGPAGTGKTLLARSFPSILPSLLKKESLEVTKIFSAAGHLNDNQSLVTERPFRSPHHTASVVSLVGGGSRPKPGEITLAHRGVLFLDEMPEFSRSTLEGLRQPLEDGVITVSRAGGTEIFPAKFILIGAMNPCPCGKLGDPEQQCTCSPGQISKYQRKLSGPFLDRIDINIEVPRLIASELSSSQLSEPSKLIRERVRKARIIQGRRFLNEKNIITNSEMRPNQTKKFCRIGLSGQNLLENAVDRMRLSVRSYYRLLKLSRTIADLDGADNIQTTHIAEAIQYSPKVEA